MAHPFISLRTSEFLPSSGLKESGSDDESDDDDDDDDDCFTQEGDWLAPFPAFYLLIASSS
jgi:hypothetical protein